MSNDHDYGQLQPSAQVQPVIQPQQGQEQIHHDLSDFFTSSEGLSSALDPSLFALAAQVQAVAHAQAQGIDIDFNIDPTFIDPIFPGTSDQNGYTGLGGMGEVGVGPIDPSLLEIAQVVEDVNKGKIRLDEPINPVGDVGGNGQAEQAGVVNGGGGGDVGLDVEIDPTLREIVNSLTNAQQSSHVNGQSLSHAQAAAAIGAHLTDAEERERLQQSLQTTLEDLTQASFNSLFPPNFPQSPSNNYLNLAPDHNLITDPSHPPQAGPSHEPTPPSGQHEEYGTKRARGRGRPKGSKNKHKSAPAPKLPKGPKAPAKPKGRPPKERNPEEQADYELRRHERELGIKRRKGRPRKFPGYLVREMRLKKNRKEFNELLRSYNLTERSKIHEDDEDSDEEDDEEEDEEGYDVNKVQEEMRMMMDVENMTNGLHQALQVNNNNDNGVMDVQQGHDDTNVNVNVFGNWSVVHDGQSLLDVVGGVGDHTMEGVFGLNHQQI
ncbi:hypothetical protein I302_106050 [Kwoniella bestiolae CBS 10118]|uniref:Uncharacterized protein n=1 Tax=Kwoniella bestiolae CBS 10118 TaxID=1296100 RepID=A0A1B9G2W1_9TREE|nr:hypothetical protein I302_05175 [Kwoniella bestiolae CBS 10118]OCF25356.1 hypothetical protein I302_05175 [Kwoniella bestiolae CBS 10118]